MQEEMTAVAYVCDQVNTSRKRCGWKLCRSGAVPTVRSGWLCEDEYRKTQCLYAEMRIDGGVGVCGTLVCRL
jgi:hypothetical protein